MSSDSANPTLSATPGGPTLRSPTAAKMLRRLMPQLDEGTLVLQTPTGERIVIASTRPGPQATMVLHRWRALRRCVLDGDRGFADGYVDGDWSTPDLVGLLDLCTRNEAALEKAATAGPFRRAFNRLRHWSRANTKRGSRRNISAHYDLGNAFYKRWLDPGMTYSSALYHGDETLEAAQDRKIDRAIDALDVQPGERVLEIGCGWGALAERLAKRHDAQVAGLTLSAEQLAHAKARIERAGLAGRVGFRLQDYRDVRETFDRIVSIEMFEAVGQKYWPVFFSTLAERLRPGGRALIQAITIEDHRFPAYSKRPDFIQQHIFPGGMLPTPTILKQEIERAGLVLEQTFAFGQSYARTLAEWQQRFQAEWPEIAAQGFGEPFKRMWEYYLAYCEVGFRFGITDVAQYRIVRP